MKIPVVAFTLGLVLLFPGSGASATEPLPDPKAVQQLLKPSRIIIHVHSSIADTGFLKYLETDLRERLQPAISIESSDFGGLSRMTDTLEGTDGLQLISRDIDWSRESGRIHVFIVPNELRLPPARFNFAVSAGTPLTPYHLIAVSLARLQSTGLIERQRDQSPRKTAERVTKLIVKNVAKVIGYSSSTQCVFGFPRSLGELDSMPLGYCEPDLSILVEAGLAQPVR